MRNKVLIVGVLAGVLVLGAAIGNADIIPMASTGLDVTTYVNRTTNWSNSGYDRLDVMVSGLNGPASGYAINIIEGTWAITGGGAFNLVSDAAIAGWNGDNGPPNRTWGDYTMNTLAAGGYPQTAIAYGQGPAPLSFVNFDANVANYDSWGRAGSGQAFSSFDGSWYTTVRSSDISDGVATTVTKMATLYIPTGSAPQLSYTGALSFSYGGGTVERGSLQAGAPLMPGDANGDGKVDINDLTIVLTHYNKSGVIWSQGDANGDGKVDINDLTIVLTNYNRTAGLGSGLATVPEPSTLVLLGVGALAAVALPPRKASLIGSPAEPTQTESSHPFRVALLFFWACQSSASDGALTATMFTNEGFANHPASRSSKDDNFRVCGKFFWRL